MYIPRDIEKIVKSALKQFPVILITGSRQSGKSTLLKTILKDYEYITLGLFSGILGISMPR
jgi:hypothetical protein